MVQNFEINSNQIDKIKEISVEEKNFRIKNLKVFNQRISILIFLEISKRLNAFPSYVITKKAKGAWNYLHAVSQGLPELFSIQLISRITRGKNFHIRSTNTRNQYCP